MNYANMIEERRMKQGFILATLISTIAGTFTTGINLYDRIIEKRKQTKLDRGQDQKIRDLERRVDEAHPGASRKRPQRGNFADDDLRGSLEQGGPMVQREYDENFAQLGSKFAQGDMTAQLQLQSQIITLQGTVIKVLEDALFAGRAPDISKLYNASEFARESSIRALRDQYRRMLEGAPLAARRPGPVRRISSNPELRNAQNDSDLGGRHRVPQKTLTMGSGDPLFCRGAKELQQHAKRHVEDILVSRGSASDMCSACGAVIDQGSWRIEKEVTVHEEYDRNAGEMVEVAEIRTFVPTTRFLAKCHREGSGYACYLCFRHRDTDTLCRGVEGLVDHIAKKHHIAEYVGDGDIREIGRDVS